MSARPVSPAEQLRRETYFIVFEDRPDSAPATHRAKRKILADLWLALGEAGKVANSPFALDSYVQAIGRDHRGARTCDEDVLDRTIAALRRKAAR